MRIKNKELRRRWHRKEQRIKEMRHAAMAAAKEGGKAPKKVEVVAEKPKKAPVKKAETTSGADKPKKAPAKKKATEAPEAPAE